MEEVINININPEKQNLISKDSEDAESDKTVNLEELQDAENFS